MVGGTRSGRPAGRPSGGRLLPHPGRPRDLIEEARRTAEAAGRDPATLELTLSALADLAELDDYAERGGPGAAAGAARRRFARRRQPRRRRALGRDDRPLPGPHAGRRHVGEPGSAATTRRRSAPLTSGVHERDQDQCHHRPRGPGDELAHRFAAWAGAVDNQAGFEGLELLKPTDGRNVWLVVTRWRDEDAVPGLGVLAGLRPRAPRRQ